MTDHWILYTPIPDTLQYDARGAGPIVADVQVIANTRPGATHPVHLRTGELASVEYTLEQSALLRARLLTAERDVRAAAAREPLTATGAEGCCEECSRAVRAGEPIVVEDEGTADRVVLHVGKCPAAQGRN